MGPTEREIKLLSLKGILKLRAEYVSEVSKIEDLVKELMIKSENHEIKEQEYTDAVIILKETKELIPLATEKVKEMAEDLRSIVNGDHTEALDRLLSEADEVCSL